MRWSCKKNKDVENHNGSKCILIGDIGDLLVECETPGYGSVCMPESFMPLFWMQNAGLDGAWRDTVLLLSMTVTTDIIGLSAGSS